jgi:hypothetical protein
MVKAAVMVSRVAIVAALVLAGCEPSGPADSSLPAYAAVATRVSWIEARIGSPPSKILDAQFLLRENAQRGGAQGPAYTARYLHAKIVIHPADAPKWAAATKPGFKPPGNPFESSAAWGMSKADYEAATFYDPTPIFGPATGGYMAITADGSSVFVYQVRN